MHVIERARQIAQELTAYDKVDKAHKELDKLTHNNSVLAQALELTARQLDHAHERLIDYKASHEVQIARLLGNI